MKPFLAMAVTLAAFSQTPIYLHSADAPLVVDVWPGPAPGEPTEGFVAEEKWLEPKPRERSDVKRLTNVTKPTLTVYRPSVGKGNGTAIVIAPGGGYSILAWDLEGTEVAEWLNSMGVTGVILKYRVPKRPDLAKGLQPPQPLMDAERAVSLVRSKADEWSIDPKRIGLLGFSAGGHLTAAVSASNGQRAYEAIDEIDRVSYRPDFAVVIYPGELLNADKTGLRDSFRLSGSIPPTFIAQATDDPIGAENALAWWQALHHLGVPVELHLYERGGHGYGLRASVNPCATWPVRCEDWMRSRGLLGGHRN